MFLLLKGNPGSGKRWQCKRIQNSPPLVDRTNLETYETVSSGGTKWFLPTH